MNNNPWVTTEEITEGLITDNSTSLCHWKELGYTSKLDAPTIGHEHLKSPNNNI